MKPQMDLQRFEELAEAYGGQLEHWPEPERHAARALLNDSPHAESLLRRAAGLDELLHTVDVDEPSPTLMARVRSIPARFEAQSSWWPFQSVWRPMLALVTSLALGVLSGLSSLEAAPEDPSVNEASIATTSGVDELSALAFGWDWEEGSEDQP